MSDTSLILSLFDCRRNRGAIAATSPELVIYEWHHARADSRMSDGGVAAGSCRTNRIALRRSTLD